MAALPFPQFNDGEAYERFMGNWSRLAGAEFLDWLALPAGLRWLDVACGNGCITELLVERCAPAQVQGIDVSEGQLAFARSREGAAAVTFHQGDAQALPFEDGEFDVAVMALAINLIPEPPKAVAEMMRVVKPGGLIASYMWDIPRGGFTMEPIRRALDEMGIATPMPGAEGSRMERMRDLWEQAELGDVESKRIDVSFTYDDFDDFWDANTGMANTVVNAVRALTPAKAEELKERLRATLTTDPNGRITYGSFANAVKGRVR
jgi:ubiquinone/menaquinone biosynthesis C-methylase UbiE